MAPTPGSHAQRAAAFDRLCSSAVVLDNGGTILHANDSWRAFARANDGTIASTGRGVNYFDVCDRSAAAGSTGAAEAVAGLRQVIAGDRERIDFEYPCPSATLYRRFLMQASAISVTGGTGLVVLHVDVSAGADLVAALSGLQGRADAAFAHSKDLVMFFGLDGTIYSASPACRQMFGIEPEDLIGLSGVDMIHPDDRERVAAAFASIPNLGDHVRTEFRVIDATGAVRWLEEIATNRVDDPNVGCIVGNVRDITERGELLQQIEADRRRLAAAQASAKLGSFEMNLETGVVTRSDELWRMLGVEPGTDPGPDFEYIHPDDRAMVREARSSALQRSPGQGDITHRIVRPDGTVRWVLSQAVRLDRANGHVVTGTMLDITERHEAELALAHQATHDWLTQLPNVASLHDRLTTTMSDVNAHGFVAIALFDIDRFKLVNDRSGHAVGDQVLRAVATRLREGLAPAVMVARVGGDEFVLLQAGVSSLDEARALGERAVTLLHDPLDIDGRDVYLTISVGVALSTEADSPTSLLQDADDAMYQAKREGRDCVTEFDHGARVRAHRRRNLAAAIPFAIERDEMHLEYQPVLDLQTLETVGFEALLRWEHPDLGTIPPEEFIPLTEISGLIVPIGNWVLDHVAQQLSAWRADQRVRADLWIAANVSASQLNQVLFADHVAATIRRAGLPPAAMHLEITESVLMDRIDVAMRTIDDLQAVGISVSIDDFGTGYSSLSYLSRLPVDTIKIDRSFVTGLGAGSHGTSIIRAMIGLAGSLGLAVIAEGVEVAGQLDLLRELGCAYGQGFLWSPSLQPDAALQWLVDHATGR